MAGRKNYTEREKLNLLELVNKYKSIIGNKSTNAVTVEKKKKTWEKIALEFNPRAEYSRSPKQLLTAYQNFKRLARQKVGQGNMKNYIFKSEDVQKEIDDDEDDKVSLCDLMEPLHSTCDSASDDFCGDVAYESDEAMVTFDKPPQPLECNVKVEVTAADDEPVPLTDPVPKSIHRSQDTASIQQKDIFESANDLKRKFYKKKLECALIEKKTKIANYKLALKNHKLIDMELKIKEHQYSSLLKNNKNNS